MEGSEVTVDPHVLVEPVELHPRLMCTKIIFPYLEPEAAKKVAYEDYANHVQHQALHDSQIHRVYMLVEFMKHLSQLAHAEEPEYSSNPKIPQHLCETHACSTRRNFDPIHQGNYKVRTHPGSEIAAEYLPVGHDELSF
jgi:hypothetical protein